jgi:ATP-binding cassette subfamily B protein
VQTLKIFGRHVWKYWPQLLICGAGVIVIIACDMVSPLIFRRLVDQLAVDPIHRAARANLSEIYHTIILVAIVSGISWIGSRSGFLALTKYENRTMKDLTDYCFAYLQNHSHRFFTDNFAGALVTRVRRFASSFETIADQATFNMGQTIVRVVCLVGILFWRNTTIGWIFFAWTILVVSFNFGFAKWKMKFDFARAEMDTKVTAQLSDTITNATTLKLCAGIDREVDRFKDVTDTLQRARYKSWYLGWCSEGVQGLLVRVLEIIVLVAAVRYWALGILTVGDVVMFRSYLSQLTENVRQMGQNIRRIYEAMADANEMTEILLTPHEVVDDEDAMELVAPSGAVEFHDVQFSYGRNGDEILQKFNLEIKAGERIGIVGPSGGGKSTILKLLERLYNVPFGEIVIDHYDIAHVTQNSLHRNIAYVPQDPILLHRTLMENIRLPRPNATDEEVINAAKAAHCHEFISNFPAGYMTPVGERGVKLSGGERQRVAIARAILMNAPILVLDEATSALDSESEMYIKDSLSKLFVGRTVIAVAHRFSTIRKMDRIIVVKGGCIVEEGDHDSLIANENGLYQRLWNLQTMDLLPDAESA